MNAAEHLAYAEKLLAVVKSNDKVQDPALLTALALEAIGHGLAAVAIELGVPHDVAAGTGAGDEH